MKIRLTIWTVIIIAMAMIIYQNRDFYLVEQTLSLDFAFAKLEMPPLANATQVLLFFLAGIVLACVSLYHERFQLRREIKKLNLAFQSCAERVTTLKSTECTQPRKKLFRLPGKLRRNKNAEPGTLITTTNGSHTPSD